MRRKAALTMAIVLVAGLVACGGAPKVEWDLEVGGAVSNPVTLSYADLAGMPQVDLKDILMEKSVGEDEVVSWSGVALDEVLSKAGAGSYASLTAVAADGYAIEISKDELQDGIVALKENGEWINKADPDHGPIRLVTPHTPANRWVFQLQALQVNEQAAGGIPADAVLTITGNVGTEVGWTDEKIRSMDTIEADSTNKAGETMTYAGVAISDLLSKAEPASDATTVAFVADDGYSAELPLADVLGCGNCMVSFGDDPGYRTVLPDFPSNVQVKGLVEIQVK